MRNSQENHFIRRNKTLSKMPSLTVGPDQVYVPARKDWPLEMVKTLHPPTTARLCGNPGVGAGGWRSHLQGTNWVLPVVSDLEVNLSPPMVSGVGQEQDGSRIHQRVRVETLFR